MNKADLIAELADRMGGDHQLATEALENTLDIIVRTVASGESITIMGFGIFEKKARAARVARNPHTGESIPVPPTYSPVFRPGQYFKSVIQGTETLPEGRLAAKRSSSHQSFGGLHTNGVGLRDKVS
ncbi:HU family DNA-binding protein [Dietzia lutea]|uniref:DNA-binding protein HupB n=1 Tax=Dietzia lutea TaxID=546160 RepID=A0A2S1R7R7_9ACTN|nr:HU family DNA-binding protein [Dietzia lutea]AWH92295.1 DNA-binding protein [Dietzia lutea]